MFDRILRFSIQQRWLVLLATLGVAAIGVYYGTLLPIDAVPDITNVQVQVNTEAPGFSPLEVEQRITFPLETVMSGLPHLEYSRSLSRYGLSQITIVFEEGTDLYFARQLVNERIQGAKSTLPPGLEPQPGPISTGLGEIFMYTVEPKAGAVKEDGTPFSPTDLRTIQDWVIKPQLRTVPGVTEVNTIGGYEKQYHVTPNPEKLAAYKLSFHDVLEALAANNGNVGAGYIEHGGEQYLVRSPGQVSTLEDIREIVVTTSDGVPVHIHDVATVGLGKELRTGAATQNGEEVVLGTAVMLIGGNSRTVSEAIAKRLAEINETLPKGVVANTAYDRTVLVNKTIDTVTKNLSEGAILVIVILILLLGNVRAAIITALVIPLAMLFTITGMVTNHVSANLMSLGALDFGIIVDGAIVIMEICMRRLGDEQHRLQRRLTVPERLAAVFDGCSEAREAVLYGQCIIMVVYLPILTLTGVEGKMFRPMAFTVLAALLGAMIFSMTFVPAALAIFLGGNISEKDNILVRWTKRLYVPVLNTALKTKAPLVVAAVVLVAICGALAMKMGTEFIPSLSEGDVAVQALRIPATNLTQSVAMQARLENELKALPEVKTVFSRIGTAEIASDPMPQSAADTFIMLKPEEEWPDPSKTHDEFLKDIEKTLATMKGDNYEVTQPIQMRFNELISGIRSDVAVKLFGDDLDVLLGTGEKMATVLEKIPGAADVKVEQVSGLPVLSITPNRKAIARLGLNVADVQEIIEVAVGGKSAGQVFEGDRRFELIVRLPEDIRGNIEALKRVPVPLQHGGGLNENIPLVNGPDAAAPAQFITLGTVADFNVAPGPNQISRENGKRRIVVGANVRGRDIGSFVTEVEAVIKQQVTIPPGYWMTWGGQFEQMTSAARRLQIVVPLAMLLIFGLLFMMFKNVKDSLLVFTGVPMALTGGIVALWLRDIPLSISAGVGFIALSGVAVLNGLVMISYIKQLRTEGLPVEQAIVQGAVTRLRALLMTALVAPLGFVPMALSTGTGAEVQRPLATVVIGGIISSTLLTLVVLPVLYRLANRQPSETR